MRLLLFLCSICNIIILQTFNRFISKLLRKSYEFTRFIRRRYLFLHQSASIEDGVLVEVTGELAKIARQHYKYPFAMTAEVHSIIQQAVDNPKTCNDYNGVWADIIWMSRCNVLNRPNNRTILFSVLITGTDKEDDVYKFKLVCVPSDDASPCMTLMLPEQD